MRRVPRAHWVRSPDDGAKHPRRKSLLLAGAFLLGAGPAAGQASLVDGEEAADRETQAEAPDRPKDMPLSQLPEARSLELTPPRPAALEALDELLSDISGPDEAERAQSELLLLRAKSDWVSGIERRANRLAERANREAMKHTLERVRDQKKLTGDAADSPDYLSFALEYPAPQDPSWRDLVQLLAMNQMLTAIGSADAARVVIFIYSRFGEFMRIDCQRQLDEIGERSVAALIDARRHPAPKIAAWAERLLLLGKKLDPHEAVRTDDSLALSEILVALGRTRDPEVTSLLLSFAASDRTLVQHAAREGLVLLGDVGSWQLKDAYQDITGKTPPREWTWKRTARELFTEYDRLKWEEAYALLATAQRALQDHNYRDMMVAYNTILAKVPAFEQQEQLATGYLTAARAWQTDQPEQALDAAFRAEELFKNPQSKAQAEALRRLLEATKLKEEGWIDQTQLARVRKLDPSLLAASQALGAGPSRGATWGKASRYVVAFTIALVALAGALWIFLSTWVRRREKPVKIAAALSSADTAKHSDTVETDSTDN